MGGGESNISHRAPAREISNSARGLLPFRMVEWAGTPTDVKLHVPPGATYAVKSNLMEKPEGPHLPLTADTVTIPPSSRLRSSLC
jgi:hypothetical protein